MTGLHGSHKGHINQIFFFLFFFGKWLQIFKQLLACGTEVCTIFTCALLCKLFFKVFPSCMQARATPYGKCTEIMNSFMA